MEFQCLKLSSCVNDLFHSIFVLFCTLFVDQTVRSIIRLRLSTFVDKFIQKKQSKKQPKKERARKLGLDASPTTAKRWKNNDRFEIRLNGVKMKKNNRILFVLGWKRIACANTFHNLHRQWNEIERRTRTQSRAFESHIQFNICSPSFVISALKWFQSIARLNETTENSSNLVANSDFAIKKLRESNRVKIYQLNDDSCSVFYFFVYFLSHWNITSRALKNWKWNQQKRVNERPTQISGQREKKAWEKLNKLSNSCSPFFSVALSFVFV